MVMFYTKVSISFCSATDLRQLYLWIQIKLKVNVQRCASRINGRMSSCLVARGENLLLNHRRISMISTARGKNLLLNHRLISISSACFSSSSLKTPTVNKASSSLSTSSHSVVKLTSCGDVSLQCMTTSDILKGTSAMLARDLFSLSLNTHACRTNPSEDTFGMKHPPPVILPRKQEVLISFGSTRALVKKDMALLFDGQKPSTQLFAGEMASYFEQKTADMLEAKRELRANGTTTDDDFRIIYPDDFEIVFIEEILRGTCDSFYRRLRIYEPIIGNLMSKVGTLYLFSLLYYMCTRPLLTSYISYV